ncbi:hypothetical protein ARMGADRAFT_1078495 [Armillaria gallica]|uniref:Uncharacterized protein n=1 Tax=Armillaria gallica TaxID=47427 RepID=A0A2H3DT17_ARMGA|nr:hypothetical protein ARMGADRAFT_1078495 [Armillaria gallica]
MLHNPWNLFLDKLSGVTKLPKAWQAYQEWFTDPANTKLIVNIVAEQWEKQVVDGMTVDGPNAGLQMAVACKLFQALDPEVREEWKEKARDVADYNKKEYVNLLKAPPSKDPVERQLGPMPRNNRQLGTLNLSWQKNLDANPVVWLHWDAKKFKEQVQDFFLDFLYTAYTVTDCKNARLPEEGSDIEGWLYGFDNELKGINQDLDDISDSSSSSEDSEAKDQPDAIAAPPRKCKHVAAKDSNVAKGTKKLVQHGGKDSNQENLPAHDDGMDEGSKGCVDEACNQD